MVIFLENTAYYWILQSIKHWIQLFLTVTPIQYLIIHLADNWYWYSVLHCCLVTIQINVTLKKLKFWKLKVTVLLFDQRGLSVTNIHFILEKRGQVQSDTQERQHLAHKPPLWESSRCMTSIWTRCDAELHSLSPNTKTNNRWQRKTCAWQYLAILD